MGIIADVNLLYKGELEYLQIIVDKYPSLISFRGKYYYRSGSTMREITRKELERALLKTQGRTWDGVPLCRGSGCKKILEDYEGQVEFDETKMPVFKADNDDFTLTLYNLNYGSGYVTPANETGTQGNTQDDTQEKIITMIKKNPQVSIADMVKNWELVLQQ